jgi:hypothetical protein
MYLIRQSDVTAAIEPAPHNHVKLSDPNVWKPVWPEGLSPWEPKHEIRSEAIGISLFRTGTKEKVHFHERIWELYEVLHGSLKVAVKCFRKDKWSCVDLAVHDYLLLSPGDVHLVDARCDHKTQVIQAPPALSDQVSVTRDDPWGDFAGLESLLGVRLADDGTVEQQAAPEKK